MNKVGLAKEMFGKKQSELNAEELKEYYREAKRRYYASPEAVEKRKQRAKGYREKYKNKIKEYREAHKDEMREYYRQYRKDGRALDNDKVLALALCLACNKLSKLPVTMEETYPKYYKKLARDIMRGKIKTELSILPNGEIETPCD